MFATNMNQIRNEEKIERKLNQMLGSGYESVLLNILINQLMKKYFLFMEPEIQQPYSNKPTVGTHPKPDKSVQQNVLLKNTW